MRIREGFVSNSSSTSFIITNTSNEPKTLEQFVIENKHLLDEFNDEYAWNNYTLGDLINATDCYEYSWGPRQSLVCTFGDEHGNALGNVYDYILRDGGKSENFTWKFLEFNR